MRLLHLAREIGRDGGGPSYSVPRLCQALGARGHEVELSYLGPEQTIPDVDVRAYPGWPILKRFAVSPGQSLALIGRADQVDVVHGHSLWSMINVASGWIVPGSRAKLVTSPRGTLSPWALSCSPHSKRAMKPFQWRALRRSDLLHATSEEEYGQIRDAGFQAPVAIIPNGIDLPGLPTDPPPAGEQRTLLFLGRIHPIKGIDRLLEAWGVLEDRFSDWRLIVAGEGRPPHEKEVMALARRLNLRRVTFPGAVFGEARNDAYLGASLFVLPTHSENFGMVVAEALAHSCPAVVGRGAPWEGIERNRCGWWVDNDVDTLIETLGGAMSAPPDELREMGRRGRQWMEDEFGWASIARRMAEAYEWVLGERSVPESVRL